MRLNVIVPASIALFFVCGCGGGGTQLANTPSTGQTVQIGPASITFSGTPQSKVGLANQTVQVTGLAGTAISSFILTPPKTLANTRILWTDGAMYSFANGVSTELPAVQNPSVGYADWTHDGHIVFSALNAATNAYALYECNYDGSATRKIADDSTLAGTLRQSSTIAVSPLNNLIAFDDGLDNIYVVSTTGTGFKLLIEGGIQPGFSPDGKTIAFTDGVSDTISTFPLAGGAITTISDMQSYYYWADYSPDGTAILATKPTFSGLSEFSSSGNSTASLLNFLPASGGAAMGTFSPDGSEIAYISNYSTATPSIVEMGLSSDNPTEVVGTPASGNIASARWSPFPGPQFFIGSSNTIMASSSGFLWGQAGDQFGGFAAFTVKTASSATITPEGSPNGTSPLVFDINADSITSFKFTNGLYSAVNSIQTSGLTDILATVSGTNGQITYVAPFIQTRGIGHPVVKRLSGETILVGRFSGLWDSKGKNVCPSGASEIHFDSSGKLLSTR